MKITYELLASAALLHMLTFVNSFRIHNVGKQMKKFDFELISGKIEKTFPDITGYTITLKAPANTKFQCVTDYITIPVQHERINAKMSPKLVVKDGIITINCYRNEMADPGSDGYVLIRSELDDGTSVNIMMNTSYGEGEYDFRRLNVLYRPISRTTANGVCQSKMAFKWESENPSDEEFTNTQANLLYIKDSQTFAQDMFMDESSNYGNMPGASLKTTRLSEDKEKEVKINIPNTAVEDIQGLSMISFNYRYTSSPVQTIYFWTIQNNDNSCIPPLKKGTVAFMRSYREGLKESLTGSIECAAMGIPAPVISIFKEIKNGKKRRIHTTTYRYFDTLSMTMKFWSWTPIDAEGKYICEATSGSKTIQRKIDLDVMPLYWDKDETKMVSKSGNIVTIQLRAEANGPLVLRCYSNSRYGNLILKEIHAGFEGYGNGNSTENVTYIHVDKRNTELSTYLEYYSPVVVSYLPAEGSRNDRNIKVVLVKLDVSKANYPLSALFCGAHEIPERNLYSDWIKVAI